MAIDWGIALGSAVNSGVDKYTRLQDQSFKDLQAKQLKTQMDEEEGYRRAQSEISGTQYEGGTAIPDLVNQGVGGPFNDEQRAYLAKSLEQMPPEQSQAALRALSNAKLTTPGHDLSNIGVYRDKQGRVLATNDHSEISPTERYRRLIDRLQKEGNISGVERALQMKSAVRQSELDDKFDKFFGGLQEEQTELQRVITEKGMQAVPGVINDKLKEHGMKAEFVANKAGGAIVVKKGKEVIQRLNSPDEVIGGLTKERVNLFSQELLPLMGNMNQVTQWLTTQYQAKQKDRELQIKAAEAASAAGYRQGMLQHQSAALAHQQQVHADGAPLRGAQLDFSKAQTANLSKLGSPIGEIDNVPVYSSLNGTVFGDGTPAPADARIMPTPGRNPQAEQLEMIAQNLKGQINPATNKEYTDQEAMVESRKILNRQDTEKRLGEARIKLLAETDLTPGTPEFEKAARAIVFGYDDQPSETARALGNITSLDPKKNTIVPPQIIAP